MKKKVYDLVKPYLLKGIFLFLIGVIPFVSKAQPVANAGDNDTICVDYYTLDANNPSPDTGVWTVVNGQGVFDNETVHNTTVRNLKKGTNIFKWTVKDEIDEVSDQVVIVNKSIVVNAGANQNECSDSIHLQAINPSPEEGIWTSIDEGGTIKTSSLYNTAVINLPLGENRFKFTVSNSHCSFSDTAILNNQLPSEAEIITEEAHLCQDSFFVEAQTITNGQGKWTIVGGSGNLINENSTSTKVTNLGQMRNTLQWKVSNENCSLIDTVSLINNQITLYAGATQTLCAFETQLKAPDPSPYLGVWTITEGEASFDNSLQGNTHIRNIKRGENTLKWTVTKNECPTSSEVLIINNMPTLAEVSDLQVICYDTTSVSANIPTVGEAHWLVPYGSAVIENSLSNITKVSQIGTGLNKIRWLIEHEGCKSEADVFITNNSLATNAGNNTTICSRSVELNSILPATATGEWTSLGSGVVENPTLYNPNANNLDFGDNLFVWTIHEDGCLGRDTVNITSDYIIAETGENRHACVKDTLRGNDPSPGSGTWTMEGGAGDIKHPNQRKTLVTDLIKGENTFRWSIDYKGCISSNDVVLINDLVYAFTGEDKDACEQTNLDAATTTEGVGLWTIMKGDGDIENPNANQTPVTNLAQGENIFRWTVSNNLCSSFQDITITNKQFYISAGIDSIICADTMQFDGEILPESTGQWTILNGFGIIETSTNAKSIVREVNSGYNRFVWKVWKDGCEDSDTIIINNNKFNTFAGLDQNNKCDTISTLEGESPLPGVGEWTTIQGFGRFVVPSFHNTEVTGIEAGENIYRWTVTKNSCTAYDDIMIFLDGPSKPKAGNDTIICQDTAQLNALEPLIGIGFWEVVDGSAIIENSILRNTPISFVKKGNNTFRWTTTHSGCSLYDDVIISNNEFVPFAGDDLKLCATSTYLNGENPAPGTGLWTIVEGEAVIDDSTNYNALVVNLNEGNSTFRWTMTKFGCSFADDINITARNQPYASAGYNAIACQDTTRLTATEVVIGNGTWSVKSGTGSFDVSTKHNTIVRDISLGVNVYKWKVVNYYCEAEDLVTITNNFFTINAGDNQNICADTLTLNAETAGTGTGVWSSNNDVNFVNINTHNTLVQNLNKGENELVWKVLRNKCSASDTVIITNNSPTKPEAGEDQIVEDTAIVSAIPTTIGTGKWISDDINIEFDDNTSYQTTIRNLKFGENELIWQVNHLECLNSDTLIARKEYHIYPGDADNNGIVNHWDVLPIGLSYNLTGQARPTTSIQWQPYYIPNWESSQPLGYNNKFTDCNGDGVIDNFDVKVVRKNFAKTHNLPQPQTAPKLEELDVKLYWEKFSEAYYLIIESDTNQVQSLYGLSFGLKIENSENVDYLNLRPYAQESWLGEESEVLTFIYSQSDSSKVYQTFVKKDQIDAQGKGRLGKIRFSFKNGNDTTGVKITPIEAKAILANGDILPITISFGNNSVVKTDNYKQQSLKLYPNPAKEVCYVDINTANIKSINIFDMVGKKQKAEYQKSTNKLQLTTKHLKSGIYLLEIKTNNQVFNGKLIIN